MRKTLLRRFAAAFGLIATAALIAGSAAASAAPPEAGHCVKVEPGTGTYRNATCVTKATGPKAQYNFVPLGVTERPTFSAAGTNFVLKTKELSTISCATASLSGEFTGAKTATVKAVLTGCKISRLDTVQEPPCQSGVTSEQIEIPIAEGELGLIKANGAVGLDLHAQPPSTKLLTADCALETTGNETVSVEGSVIGKITPINLMSGSLSLNYKATKGGKQIPEKFETGEKDTLTTTFTGLAGSFSGPSWLNITGLAGTYSEPIEIKNK